MAHATLLVKSKQWLISKGLSLYGKHIVNFEKGFPDGSVGEESAFNAVNARDAGSILGSGRSPGEGNGNPLLPGRLHGQRGLAGYSPKGC